jgi:parvulin-like peptidyl-prolyl isomerase
MLCCGSAGLAQQADAPVVLDSVVAVVNNQVILTSDVDRAVRLAVLAPETADKKPDRKSALDRLISRALIEQQMTPDEAQSAQPTGKQLESALDELRTDLPACVRYNCSLQEGWSAFLAAHGFTEDQVDTYLRERLKILGFIENRFRQGIRISQEEIEAYYRDTLLPQYPAGQGAPKLDTVAPRISEILLQQQVNALFDSWLENLRKQGDVEIIEPTLSPAGEPAHNGGNS